MNDSLETVTKTLTGAFEKVTEVVKDRLFSPMYFYFLTSWAIVNWKFVYTLLFVDSTFIWNTHFVTKVEYLSQMYEGDLIAAALRLLIIPAVAAYVAVWWFSKLSELFFKRYEEHQMSKRSILRQVEYREKVSIARTEREIREQDPDKRIPYDQNPEFNQSLDDAQPLVVVAGTSLLPSEVLYNTDYGVYKAALDEYLEKQVQMGEDLAVQAEIDRRRGK